MKLRAGLAATLVLGACGRTTPPPAQPAAIRFESAGARTPAQHGRRLARVLGCEGCHGADLQGRPWDEEADFAISFTSNLTRALPAYSNARIERAIREGVRRDGSQLWGMPSEIFTHLDPADMAALIAHLRTIRPAGRIHPRAVFGPGGRREIATGSYKPAPQLAREGQTVAPAPLEGRLRLMGEVARGRFAHLTGREVDAIYDYLVARARQAQ